MAELYYLRMVGLTLGALVHLFLLVLIAGSRRRRGAFEWLLLATVMSLFLFHSGALLAVNTEIHYPEPPETTWQFAIALMAAGLGILPGALRRDREMVVAEIDRLSAKLAQLLGFARPAVRSGDGATATPALAHAENLAGLLRREAERRRVRLELERPAEEMHVRAAPDAWNDILSNLLVNAIEAAPAGGIVCLRLTQQGGELVAELRERIFEPFFTTRPSGTGLGLAIVARRLAELGGTIRCESPVTDGRGTRFVATLPLAGPGPVEAKED
jgi:signal transduction histidine kinase